MKKKTPSLQQLEDENLELHRLLGEAEATLRTIRQHGVDAFVIGAAEKPAHILTLAGAEYPYRVMVESMIEGAVTMIPDGTIFFCNPRFAEMMRRLPEQLIGTPFRDLVPSYEREKFAALLEASKEANVRGELHLQTDPEIQIPVQLSINPLQTEGVLGISIVVTDLTEFKRATEQMEASEQRYRTLVNQLPAVVYSRELSGQVRFVSPQVEQLLGYSVEEWEHGGLDLWQERIHPDDCESVVQTYRDFIHGKGSFKCEYRIRRKDGGLLWVNDQAQLLLDRVRRTTFIQGVTFDVHERRQAEEELRAGEERVRAAFEAHMDAFFLLKCWRDEAGHVIDFILVDANSRAEEQLNQARESLIGRRMSEVYPLNREGGTFEKYVKVYETGHAMEEEYFIPQDQALYGWYYQQVVPLADGVAITNRDITGRKQAEQALRESETKWGNVIQASADAILLTDEKGALIEWNQAEEELTGLKPAQVLGRTLWEVHYESMPSEEKREASLEMLEALESQFFKTGDLPQDFMLQEQRIVRPDGSLRVGQTSLFPIPTDRGYRLGAITRDITEQTRAEQALHESETKYHSVVTALADGVVLQEPGGAIIAANPAAERILGLSMDQLLGRTSIDPRWGAIHEDGSPYPGDIHPAMLTLATGQPQRGVVMGVHKPDGSLTWLSINSEPLAHPGENTPHAVVTTFHDITESKRAQERIEQQLNQLRALHSIDLAISSSTDLHLSLRTIVDQAVAKLKVAAVDVLLLNPYSLTLEYGAGQGFRGHAIEQSSVRLGEGFAGRAALDRKLVAIHNLQAEPNEFTRLLDLENENFVSYWGVPLIAKGKVQGVLEAFTRHRYEFSQDWLEFLEALAGQAAIAIDNAGLFEGLHRSNTELMIAYDATIEGWSQAMDLRDKETEGHTLRVTDLTLNLARRSGMSDEQLVHIKRGALLHDMGKLGMPDAILHKPGGLTADEMELMKRHPQIAHELLSPIAYLRPALDIPYCHHERWDGSGYPRGLKGEHIPLAARLFAVVDVWDALRSDRPYRLAWSREKALEYIRGQAGVAFDPRVVELFLEVVNEGDEG